MSKLTPGIFTALIQTAAVASVLWTALPHGAFATSTEPVTDPQVDPAPCVAATATNDADNIIVICGALADNDKTLKADRIKALIARAGAYGRKEMIDRAIGDYDAVLRLDPTLADIFNIRGELWRRKGDRPRALADFGAAIKLNPQHEAARQLQVAGPGAGAARCADGRQEQANCSPEIKSALEMMPLPVTIRIK